MRRSKPPHGPTTAHPNLTQEMIESARIYVQAHPRRGRPRKPSWRKAKPLSSQLVLRRSA